jgi:hypothetical protein
MGNKSITEYKKCDNHFAKCTTFDDIMKILQTEHFSKDVRHEYRRFYKSTKKSNFDIDRLASEYLKNIKCNDNLFKPFELLEYDIFRLYKYNIVKIKCFAHSGNIVLIKRMMLYFFKDAKIFEKFINKMEVHYGRSFAHTTLSLLVDLAKAENKEIYHVDKYVHI